MTELVADFTQEYYTILIALHAFTQSSSTRAFKGIRKVKRIKLLQKHQDSRMFLAKLGEEWEVSDDVIAGIEVSPVLYMGGADLQVLTNYGTFSSKRM